MGLCAPSVVLFVIFIRRLNLLYVVDQGQVKKFLTFWGFLGLEKVTKKSPKSHYFISLVSSFQYSILIQKSIWFSSFQYSSFPSFPSFQCHRQQGSRTRQVPSFLVLQFLVFYQYNQIFQYSSFLVFSTTSSQFFSNIVPSFVSTLVSFLVYQFLSFQYYRFLVFQYSSSQFFILTFW